MKTKLYLSLTFFLFFFIYNVSAQFRLGFKAGPSFVDIQQNNFSEELGKYDFRLAYHLGGTFGYDLNATFGLRVELLYASRGGEYNGNFGRSDIKIDYFTLPIILDYSPIKKLHLEVGPEISLLRFAESPVSVIPTKDLFQDVDFLLHAGLRYYFWEQIYLGARYNLGLTNIQDVQFTDQNGQAIDNRDFITRNHGFHLSVGWEYFFGQ